MNNSFSYLSSVPSFDGEKGYERLIQAITEEKRRTTQISPLVITFYLSSFLK